MRVATITCHKACNYGARLQAYALAAYIQSLGHQVQVIDYVPPYLDFYLKKWYNAGLDLKEWVKVVVRFNDRCRQISKFEKLEAFSQKFIPKTSKLYSDIDKLRSCAPEADVYVAGSDQIWNTTFRNGKDPAFYLDFGPEGTKKISYAASFAIPEMDETLKPIVAEKLRGLDAISVREASGVKIVESLGLEAAWTCDPAFLIDSKQWAEIAETPDHQDPYLLIYDFESSDEMRRVVTRIARQRNLKIYSVSPKRLRYADKNFCDCSAEMFLGLIRDASCVVSNSLHGSIFSMIFGKDFYVVNRLDGLNVRMADLLTRYSLDSRLVSSASPDRALTESIDYDKLRAQLNEDISNSKQWLADQLAK